MAVKIGKLWNKADFVELTIEAKLLYIYLATSPDINSVGVLCPNLEVASIQTKIPSEKVNTSCRELMDNGFIFAGMYDKRMYFVVLNHFNTIPKSDSAVARVTKDIISLPQKLQGKLKSLGITVDRKAITFKEPTPEEISQYAMSQGHLIDANMVISFYKGNAQKRNVDGWMDSRGRRVKDWKAKLRLVWFKDENKLKEVKGAPKGFEYFYIMLDGKMIFPESWKGGKPHSKNLVIKKALEKEYENKRTNK
jgi:hypothetical protein